MDDEDEDDDDEDEDEEEVDNVRKGRVTANADVLLDAPPTVNLMEHAFDTGLTGGSYIRAGNPGQDHERGREIHSAEDLINAMTESERRDLIRKLGAVPTEDLPSGGLDEDVLDPAGVEKGAELQGRMADQDVERGSKGLKKPKRAKRNGAPSPVEGVGGEGSRIEDLDFRGRRALEVHKPTSNGYGEILENPLDGLGDADCLRRAVVLNELDRRSNLAKQIATPRRQVPVRNRRRYATTSSDTLGDPPGLWTS
jgi:hypothetical protein